MRKVMIVVTLLALSGCAQNVADICSGYGYEPGTEGFRNCAMQVDLARQQRAAIIFGGM